MKILVLNGSPRKKSNVADLLIKQTQIFLEKNPSSEIIWENVCDLNFNICHDCMACLQIQKKQK